MYSCLRTFICNHTSIFNNLCVHQAKNTLLVLLANAKNFWQLSQFSGPILESKGMHTIFQKNGKKGKIFENLGKMYKI